VTSRTDRWTVAGAAVVLGALATWNSFHKSLWVDEAYSEFTSRLPLAGATYRALHYELQPPLYFSLLDLWRDLDRSFMWGRALSTVAAMAFVCVVAGIGRRAGLTRWSWLATAAAFLPGTVWAAAELRGYALVMLLAALTVYFYLGIIGDPTHAARGDAIGYVLAATALLYTFYYGGFVLAGQWIAALVTRRRPGKLTVLLAIVGCAMLPMVSIILSQVAQHPIDTARIDLATHARYAIFKTAGAMVGAFEGRADVPSWPHVLPIVFVIAISVPILRTLAARQRWDADEVAIAIVAVTPVAVLGLLRLFAVTPVHPQHFLVTLPGLLLVYGVWLHRMAPTPRLIAGGILTAGSLACLVSYQQHGVQREDWRSAAQYVAAHAGTDDAVLMYDPDRALPFDDYFAPASGHAPVYGLPVDMNLEHYDPFAYAIRDTTVVAARIRSLNLLGRSLWFVSAAQLLDPLKDSPGVVISYLSAHDHIDPAVTFIGVRVIHIEPR
jgi:hypothetical protein